MDSFGEGDHFVDGGVEVCGCITGESEVACPSVVEDLVFAVGVVVAVVSVTDVG